MRQGGPQSLHLMVSLERSGENSPVNVHKIGSAGAVCPSGTVFELKILTKEGRKELGHPSLRSEGKRGGDRLSLLNTDETDFTIERQDLRVQVGGNKLLNRY